MSSANVIPLVSLRAIMWECTVTADCTCSRAVACLSCQGSPHLYGKEGELDRVRYAAGWPRTVMLSGDRAGRQRNSRMNTLSPAEPRLLSAGNFIDSVGVAREIAYVCVSVVLARERQCRATESVEGRDWTCCRPPVVTAWIRVDTLSVYRC